MRVFILARLIPFFWFATAAIICAPLLEFIFSGNFHFDIFTDLGSYWIGLVMAPFAGLWGAVFGPTLLGTRKNEFLVRILIGMTINASSCASFLFCILISDHFCNGLTSSLKILVLGFFGLAYGAFHPVIFLTGCSFAVALPWLLNKVFRMNQQLNLMFRGTD